LKCGISRTCIKRTSDSIWICVRRDKGHAYVSEAKDTHGVGITSGVAIKPLARQEMIFFARIADFPSPISVFLPQIEEISLLIHPHLTQLGQGDHNAVTVSMRVGPSREEPGHISALPKRGGLVGRYQGGAWDEDFSNVGPIVT